MDLSALSIPLRKDRSDKPIFSIRPPISSVNVSYETAEATKGEYSGRDDDNGSSKTSNDDANDSQSINNGVSSDYQYRADSATNNAESTKEEQNGPKIDDDDDDNDDDFNSRFGGNESPGSRSPNMHSSASQYSLQRTPSSRTLSHTPNEFAADSLKSPPSHTSTSGSPVGSTHAFPIKESSPQREVPDSSSVSTPTKSNLLAAPRGRHRARSSFSIASTECQQFVASLQEPKYAKPLTADEISWIFQDFYLKLRGEILGSDNELLTQEEQEERKQAENDIEMILDKAEKAVTGGKLYSKLFALGGNHDQVLQPKINAIRENPVVLLGLTSSLDLGNVDADEQELNNAVGQLNRLNKETSPKAKLAVLIKAHHCLVNSLPRNSGDADTVFPLFVLCLAQSNAEDLWQNFLFIQRFRRSSELVGQAAYCLTNLEAAIHVFEQWTTDSVPDGVDASLFQKPITNPRAAAPRERSSSQSSKGSNSNSTTVTASFSQRLGETLNSYRSMLATARKPHQPPPAIINQRFLNSDAEQLTIGDVRVLLREYKRLAEFIESRRPTPFTAVPDSK